MPKKLLKAKKAILDKWEISAGKEEKWDEMTGETKYALRPSCKKQRKIDNKSRKKGS